MTKKKKKRLFPLGKSWRGPLVCTGVELKKGVRLEIRRQMGREWKSVIACPRDFKGLVDKF